MSLMYNDKDFAVIYKNIPDKVRPAICVCEPVEFTGTKYEF